ncbi:MAG: TIGR02757 family protein [Flavobacteriales bacterium]|nr:TIGR02757 family protein [Flavobacteriales bacterium]
MMNTELKDFLDVKVEEYNQHSFIEDDPISIPHLLDQKEDIEIISFIVATIAWGKRESIIKNGKKLLDIMGHEPYRFTMEASEKEKKGLDFVHRTFNARDLHFFLNALKSIYQNHGGLENTFSQGEDIKQKIVHFRDTFLLTPHEQRSEKHISNPLRNSACKRINMFLRWMVRKDKKRVDFGIWNEISTAELYVPLDVHVGNVAREIGLLKRKANDWKALEELMNVLQALDPVDPCKYDFALFGIGINNDLNLK